MNQRNIVLEYFEYKESFTKIYVLSSQILKYIEIVEY